MMLFCFYFLWFHNHRLSNLHKYRIHQLSTCIFIYGSGLDIYIISENVNVNSTNLLLLDIKDVVGCTLRCFISPSIAIKKKKQGKTGKCLIYSKSEGAFLQLYLFISILTLLQNKTGPISIYLKVKKIFGFGKSNSINNSHNYYSFYDCVTFSILVLLNW